MKLLRIDDINKLPNGTYLGNVNQAHTFTPFAKEVLAKQLFTLGLQNKEYFSVAEIKEAIDKHINPQLPPEITTITPTEVISESLINNVEVSEVAILTNDEITPLEAKESIITTNQESEESKVVPSKKKRT